MREIRWLLLPVLVYAGVLFLAWVSTMPAVQSAMAATIHDLGPAAVGGQRFAAAHEYLAGRAFPHIPDFPWGHRVLALELLVSGLLALRVARGWLAAERSLAALLWGTCGLVMLVVAVQTGSDILDNILALKGQVGGLLQSLRYLASGALVAFLAFALVTTRSTLVRISLGLAALVVLDGVFFAAGGPDGAYALVSPSYRLGSLVLGLAFDLQQTDLDGFAWLLTDDLLIDGTDLQALMFLNLAVALVGVGAWAQLEEMGRASREGRI